MRLFSGLTTPKNHAVDMCEGPIFKKLLLFAVPIMFSGILQLLFNAADIVVVGNFAGDTSLAAVGSNTAIINLLTNLFMGFSIGANVLAAKLFGAKRMDELSKAAHTAIVLGLACGVVLTVMGIGLAKQLLIWMQTPSEVLPLATLYLRIYFAGTIPTMLYNFGSALLRAVGDTQRPLYFLLLAGVVNVGLNLLFVIVFKMDVAGVALATIISQTISAILVMICLFREKSAVKICIKNLKVDRDKLVQIIKIGLPAGIQGIIFSLSNVVIQSSINLFGTISVAGNSAAANLEGFVYFAMTAFYQATISFVSQNFGAGKLRRIDRIVILAELCVTAVGLIFGNLIVLVGEQLLGIYTSDPAVIAAGLERMQVICRTYVLCGMMEVLVGALRGVGYSVTPMLISLIGVCGVRLLWIATVFQSAKYHLLTTVYLSYPISWLIAIIALLVCFLIVRRLLRRRQAAATPALLPVAMPPAEITNTSTAVATIPNDKQPKTDA